MNEVEIVGRGELYKALAKFQKGIGPVPKKHKATIRGESKAGNPYEYDYSYANLSDTIDLIREPLAEAGLCVFQTFGHESDLKATIVTTLAHESGASIESVLAISSAGSMQDIGSQITYGRRYALQAILGIAAEDTDAIETRSLQTVVDEAVPGMRGAIGDDRAHDVYEIWSELNEREQGAVWRELSTKEREKARVLLDQVRKELKEKS